MSGSQNKESMGVVLHIVGANLNEQASNEMYIEIRNENNMNKQQRGSILRDSQKTKLAKGPKPIWNEDFFYNTQEMLEDNITFILRNQNGQEIGRLTLKKISSNQSIKKGKDNRLNFDLYHNQQSIGDLQISVSFFERQDILGGIKFPDLSLVPSGKILAQNAIDNIKTPTANCFSYCDNGVISGFENERQFFPAKYKLFGKNVTK